MGNTSKAANLACGAWRLGICRFFLRGLSNLFERCEEAMRARAIDGRFQPVVL